MTDGSDSQGRFAVNWTVQPVAGGSARSVTVVVTSPTATATRADTFVTTIGC